MRGSYRIRISNSKIAYDFTVKRNITIIKGNSATGKTTLINLINEYYEAGTKSGIELRADVPCRTLSGRDWSVLLPSIHGSIVFIDEDNVFVSSDEFSEAVKNSDNYYVIITREGLSNLPYSVNEIYGIRVSGKYAGLKQVYNELYNIYGDYTEYRMSEKIIVEDSNSGFNFFEWKLDI